MPASDAEYEPSESNAGDATVLGEYKGELNLVVIQTHCDLKGIGVQQIPVHKPGEGTVARSPIDEWDVIKALRGDLDSSLGCDIVGCQKHNTSHRTFILNFDSISAATSARKKFTLEGFEVKRVKAEYKEKYKEYQRKGEAVIYEEREFGRSEVDAYGSYTKPDHSQWAPAYVLRFWSYEHQGTLDTRRKDRGATARAAAASQVECIKVAAADTDHPSEPHVSTPGARAPPLADNIWLWYKDAKARLAIPRNKEASFALGDFNMDHFSELKRLADQFSCVVPKRPRALRPGARHLTKPPYEHVIQALDDLERDFKMKISADSLHYSGVVDALEIVAFAPPEAMRHEYIPRAKLLLQSPCVQNLYHERARLQKRQNPQHAETNMPRPQSTGNPVTPSSSLATPSTSESKRESARGIKHELLDDLKEPTPEMSKPPKKKRRSSAVKVEVIEID